MLSPATFLVYSPQALLTTLEITPQSIMTERYDNYYEYATLKVESGNGAVTAEAPIAPGQMTSVPVALSPGSQIITFTVTPTADSQPSDQPLTFAINQVNLTTAGLPDAAVPVEGDAAATVQAAYGAGWYAAESAGDGTATWRWASSPADLWVYSTVPQTVTLAATPIALHVADSGDGKGNQGVLRFGPSGAELPVEVGQPFSQPIPLQAGWNTITLALDAGNFRPVDYDASTGDARPLSFSLQGSTLR